MLFVWAYTHYAGMVHTHGLTEDGKMLFRIAVNIDGREEPRSEAHQKQHKENVRLLIAGNETLNEEYTIEIADQKKLEAHLYDGASREENVSPEFRKAWDRFKDNEASELEELSRMTASN